MKETEYSWKETETHLQIFFTIDGLADLPNDLIKLKMTKYNLKLFIKAKRGQELSQAKKIEIENFHDEVIPSKTTSVRKSNVLTILVMKKYSKIWGRIEKHVQNKENIAEVRKSR